MIKDPPPIMIKPDYRHFDFFTLFGLATGPVPAMKSEATAIFAPQDGRWKITVSFDGRRLVGQ